METHWVSSKWSRDELQDQTVEFRVPVPEGVLVGKGAFLVRENPEGLLSIWIRVRTLQNPGTALLTDISLAQSGADLIERHPAPETAQFHLFGA
jgi:hypothetical protein